MSLYIEQGLEEQTLPSAASRVAVDCQRTARRYVPEDRSDMFLRNAVFQRDCKPLWPRRWAQLVPPKRSLSKGLQAVMAQKMGAICSSETQSDFRRDHTEDSAVLRPRCENFRSFGAVQRLAPVITATSVKLPKQNFVMSNTSHCAVLSTFPATVAPATSCEQVHPAIHNI
jgi:hypothetical protein